MAVGTRDLALYGAIIATLNGLWSLYHNVWRDRPRVRLRAYEAKTLEISGEIGDPVFAVDVSNRGRRAVEIVNVGYLKGRRRERSDAYVREMALPAERPAVRIEEGAEHSFRCGLAGSYKPGDLPVTRWFAWDATGRKYPLRERYRQRIEHVIWGTPPQRLD